MAQHIGKHIPGHPTVIVQNMPGAGGVIAANFIYGLAKPDGLTIGAFNPARSTSNNSSAARKSNSIGANLPGSAHRRKMTSSTSYAPTRRLKRSTICATPRSRPNAAAPAPAPRLIIFPGCSKTRWASRQPLSPVIKAAPKLTSPSRRNEVICWSPLSGNLLRPRALQALAQVRIHPRRRPNRRKTR